MGNTITTTQPALTVAITTSPNTTEAIRSYNGIPITTVQEKTITPTNTVAGENECQPQDRILSTNECNALTNCIYAANYCYKIKFDNIGLLDTINVSCTTNRNLDGSYTVQFQSAKVGLLYVIKKISFIVKDNDDVSGNPFLSATYLNLDMTNPQDKAKILVIDGNGQLSFTIKIIGGSGTSNFDFTNLTLTDINNRTLTLTDTSPVNTIYNKTSFTTLRNKMVKITYDPSIAQKAQQIYIQNQIGLNNIANTI